jgi:hypothetical protein
MPVINALAEGPFYEQGKQIPSPFFLKKKF